MGKILVLFILLFITVGVFKKERTVNSYSGSDGNIGSAVAPDERVFLVFNDTYVYVLNLVSLDGGTLLSPARQGPGESSYIRVPNRTTATARYDVINAAGAKAGDLTVQIICNVTGNRDLSSYKVTVNTVPLGADMGRRTSDAPLVLFITRPS
ncbi:hypothetical protein M3223_14705 [Paenibacillus pasadenensis]|uniref:hypothetical protein n=1 Tax=Paenibacillus pasadenensis TaxID=217090 RepID=UPI00203C5B9D|nr:hypothetical protein [Paenibacillus pasadenensis]MCM3748599.1 hypothetical protein [Paenibacillus pasadenensis]